MMEENVENFFDKFYQHGLGCGKEIAAILHKKHPDYLVYALYRSAIAIKYDPENNHIDVFASGDPHAMGGEVNDESIAAGEIHMAITGDRWGPKFLEKRRGTWIQLNVDEEDWYGLQEVMSKIPEVNGG